MKKNGKNVAKMSDAKINNNNPKLQKSNQELVRIRWPKSRRWEKSSWESSLWSKAAMREWSRTSNRRRSYEDSFQLENNKAPNCWIETYLN